MKQVINNFINSIDAKLYNRIRASKGDAECRRYLKEHLQKKLTLTDVSQQREQLKAYAELIQSSYTNHFFDDAVEESIDEFLSL